MSRAIDIFGRIQREGLAAIDEFVDLSASEELFLDFKLSANEGDGNCLADEDRNNLAKAISGFGNSDGGVIIWGIECRPQNKRGDVAANKRPIVDPTRFRSWLEGAVSGRTIPPHSGVMHHVIYASDRSRGYVITLVPSSDHAPLQALPEQKYYMRAGSNFLPVPHAVLAGMFGRRPQADVIYNFHIGGRPEVVGNQTMIFGFSIALHNRGRGVAELSYLNLVCRSAGGPHCRVDYRRENETAWGLSATYSNFESFVANSDTRIGPEGYIVALNVSVRLAPPFNEPLILAGNCGCSSGPSYPIELRCEAADLKSAYAWFFERWQTNSPEVMNNRNVSDKVFGPLDQPPES
jgi:hypothetical protein